MTLHAIRYALAVCAMGFIAAVGAQATNKSVTSTADPAAVVTWSCSPFYLPARSIWKRTVDIAYDDKRVLAVRVDGAPVYSFSLNGTQILTAVDGERIQLDTDAQTWTSDLRGMVTAQGRCER